MNLVVIHYHLNRGGVTSVIRNQLQALAGNSPFTDVLVLHGSGTEGWNDGNQDLHLKRGFDRFEFVEVPEIGYRQNEMVDDQLFKVLKQSIDQYGFEPEQTLIQAHNHNLGKNNMLTATLPRLVKELGYSMLLQIHDFAEDMRPVNFGAIREFCRLNKLSSSDFLYPNDSRIHFAFLNRRDLDLLSDTIVNGNRCHLLPNPVTSLSAQQDSTPPQENADIRDRVRRTLSCNESDKLVVYPVRAIRRKNIGEAMLLAASGQDAKVAVTLPAVSDDEVGQYKKMIRASERLGLPIVFEAGLKGLEFGELISSADFVFSSSIAEGFGMVFLESWSWGKHLMGRNLRGITLDFEEEGLDLSGLYQEVKIPLAWLDLEQEKTNQQKLLNKILDQFETSLSEPINFEQEQTQGWIDFAKLSHRTQLMIIEKVWESEALQQTLLSDNPAFQIPTFNPGLVRQNSETVESRFTIAPFRQRFLSAVEAIFDSEVNSSAPEPANPTQDFLVESFLDPKNFYPLLVEKE